MSNHVVEVNWSIFDNSLITYCDLKAQVYKLHMIFEDISENGLINENLALLCEVDGFIEQYVNDINLLFENVNVHDIT